MLREFNIHPQAVIGCSEFNIQPQGSEFNIQPQAVIGCSEFNIQPQAVIGCSEFNIQPQGSEFNIQPQAVFDTYDNPSFFLSIMHSQAPTKSFYLYNTQLQSPISSRSVKDLRILLYYN